MSQGSQKTEYPAVGVYDVDERSIGRCQVTLRAGVHVQGISCVQSRYPGNLYGMFFFTSIFIRIGVNRYVFEIFDLSRCQGFAHEAGHFGTETESDNMELGHGHGAMVLEPFDHPRYVRSDESAVAHRTHVPWQRRQFAPVNEDHVVIAALQIS